MRILYTVLQLCWIKRSLRMREYELRLLQSDEARMQSA
jgi:hypothetical protein